MTRRELVKRGGIVGAAVMLGGAAALARPARAAVGWNRARIAIVGGGIAGLSAALRLQDREPRAGRPLLTIRPAAGRRLHRGVRRGHPQQGSLNLLYLLGFQPDDITGFSIFGASDERFHIAGGNE